MLPPQLSNLPYPDFFVFAFRILLPIILVLLTLFILFMRERKTVGGRIRSYVFLALFSFYYGAFNMIAQAIEDGLWWSYSVNSFSWDRLQHYIERYLHGQAENLVFLTVGLSLLAVIDAIAITRADIDDSEKRIRKDIKRIRKDVSDVIPILVLARSPKRRWWRILIGR